MTDPGPVADPLTPAQRRELERKLAATAARLKKGEVARAKRMETDSAFARRVRGVAEMPKPVKVLYADLCAEALPRNLCYLVHKEISEATYSAETLEKCAKLPGWNAEMADRIRAAIALRKDKGQKH